jgi:hypothetical protein
VKTRIILLAVCLLFVAIPATAQYIYDNGPTTGTADAWTINFGFSVTDSFITSSETSPTGASFIFWLTPGDTGPSVDLSIGTSPFNSNVASFTGLASFGSTNLGTNQYGFTLEEDAYYFSNVALNPGTTYWITLQNASVPSGDPVYWDENSGPSMAQENSLGTIPSESFSILGACGVRNNGPDCGPPGTPEPGSFILFGSGIVGLASLLRFRMRF